MHIPSQQQEWPGSTARLDPAPDHGESSYEGHGRLAGKCALITGADSGIGRAVAIAFAREGADVALSYYDEHEDAESTAQLVRAAGRRVVLLPGDLSQPQHCRDIVQRSVDELGGWMCWCRTPPSRWPETPSSMFPTRSGTSPLRPTCRPSSTW